MVSTRVLLLVLLESSGNEPKALVTNNQLIGLYVACVCGKLRDDDAEVVIDALVTHVTKWRHIRHEDLLD